MLKLSMDALIVMDAIARKGSFAAAAESLHRVPSAITYTIRKLEEDLGITLFDRRGHRAYLTEAGLELLNEGRHLLTAAQTLESRVKRIASGIETDICIAINDLMQEKAVYKVLEAFYAQGFGTRVKLVREVFGGSWDALTTGRADISIGAPGDAPATTGVNTLLLGQLEFVFAVAPHHPLAAHDEPLLNQHILPYRVVAAADSSRNLPPRTSGILSGQDVLTVPDMQSKLNAQLAGLGVGYLPRKLAQHHAKLGQLVIKTVTEPKHIAPTYLAWTHQDGANMGKAQQWLIKQISNLSLDELLM